MFLIIFCIHKVGEKFFRMLTQLGSQVFRIVFTDQADLFTACGTFFQNFFDTKATPVGASQTDPTQGRAHGVWPIHFKRTTIGRCRHIYPKQGHSSQAHKTDRPVVLAGSGYRKSAEAGQSHAREHENTFKSWVCQKSFGDQRHHHNQPR